MMESFDSEENILYNCVEGSKSLRSRSTDHWIDHASERKREKDQTACFLDNSARASSYEQPDVLFMRSVASFVITPACTA